MEYDAAYTGYDEPSMITFQKKQLYEKISYFVFSFDYNQNLINYF